MSLLLLKIGLTAFTLSLPLMIWCVADDAEDSDWRVRLFILLWCVAAMCVALGGLLVLWSL